MSSDKHTYTSNLVAFAMALQDRGVNVSTGDLVSAARALKAIDLLDRSQFYYGLRTTIIDEPTERDVFDELFVEYWDELSDETFNEDSISDTGVADVDEHIVEGGGLGDKDSREMDANKYDVSSTGDSTVDNTKALSEFAEQLSNSHGGAQSDDSEEKTLEIGKQEQSTRPSLAAETNEHVSTELPLLVGEFGRQLGTLQGFHQRLQPSGDIDLRRSLNMVRQKNPNDLPRIREERSQAKIRFFVDVSHSMLQNMEQRFLLLFLFECMRQFANVRIFIFDTNATEVTHHFQSADITSTVEEMRRAQTEWGAGTTIGDCLAEIQSMDPFVVDRETVAVIISDGWDAGNLDILDEQMQHLNRRCENVLWFNPQASSSKYEPNVSGMRTALPYISGLFGFADIDDLRTIVEHLRSTRS